MITDPSHLRITAVDTPDGTDPPNADKFYAALGRLTVAWGRFEGHFINAILVIQNLQGYAYAVDTTVPMAWEGRIKAWQKGFGNIAELAPKRAEAENYIERTKAAVEDRHIAAHSVWDTFKRTVEPTINARRIRSEGKGRIVVEDYELTLSMLERALINVNQLNRDLVPFTTFLNDLRPVPEGAKKL